MSQRSVLRCSGLHCSAPADVRRIWRQAIGRASSVGSAHSSLAPGSISCRPGASIRRTRPCSLLIGSLLIGSLLIVFPSAGNYAFSRSVPVRRSSEWFVGHDVVTLVEHAGIVLRLKFGLARGVSVDVLLTRKMPDPEHQRVGHCPERHGVGPWVAMFVGKQWLTETNRGRIEELWKRRIGWLDIAHTHQTNRDDRCTGSMRKPGDAGSALVEVAGAGTESPRDKSRRVRRCQAMQLRCRGRPQRRRPHCDRWESCQALERCVWSFQSSRYFGLADITDIARQHRRHDERIEHRRVIGCNDRRSIGRHVLQAEDREIEHAPEDGSDRLADNRLESS